MNEIWLYLSQINLNGYELQKVDDFFKSSDLNEKQSLVLCDLLDLIINKKDVEIVESYEKGYEDGKEAK